MFTTKGNFEVKQKIVCNKYARFEIRLICKLKTFLFSTDNNLNVYCICLESINYSNLPQANNFSLFTEHELLFLRTLLNLTKHNFRFYIMHKKMYENFYFML